MTHKFSSWQHLNLNGRLKKHARERATRERRLVQKALSSLGLRYREIIPFRNPHWRGKNGDIESAVQWLDFVVFYKGRMHVLVFKMRLRNSGTKPHERASYKAKMKFLEEKGVPLMILNRKDTSQIYAFRIMTFLKKEAH